MRPILLAIAAVLAIILYRMLSRGGKTYAYDRTQYISFLSDGSEHVISEQASGSIIITGKTVMIDGLEYIYKPADNEPVQALLDYDESGLRSVKVLLIDGERQYFINRTPAGQPA